MNKYIKISQIKPGSKIVSVVCDIPNYTYVSKRIEIGQFISTHAFDVNFSNFTSKWTLIFYPKGQYDYGFASKNCRAYLKMNTCNKSHQIIKMKINICVKSSSSTIESEFLFNDKNRNWSGPFLMDSIKEVEIDDNLKITCNFEIIRSESEAGVKKRSSSINVENRKKKQEINKLNFFT